LHLLFLLLDGLLRRSGANLYTITENGDSSVPTKRCASAVKLLKLWIHYGWAGRREGKRGESVRFRDLAFPKSGMTWAEYSGYFWLQFQWQPDSAILVIDAFDLGLSL